MMWRTRPVIVLGTDELRGFAFRLAPKDVQQRWPELVPGDVTTRLK